MSVKIRKVGTSNVLTVPQKIEYPQGTEFDVYKGRSGQLIFTPKRRNPFVGDWYHHDLSQTSEFEDVKQIGIELDGQ